jgi:hypothetical protein
LVKEIVNPIEKIPLESRDALYLSSMNIIELVLPPCKEVYCHSAYLAKINSNKLTKLIIPDGYNIVRCDGNELTELILSKSCKRIYCWNNQLTELIIPEGCEWVHCHHNKLNKLIVPKSCTTISCHDNNLPQIIVDLFQSNDPIKIQLANNLQR